MRALLAVLVVASALTAGNFGEGEGLVDEEAMSPIWKAMRSSSGAATTLGPSTIDLALNQSGETTRRSSTAITAATAASTTSPPPRRARSSTSAANIQSTRWTAVTTGTRGSWRAARPQSPHLVPTNPGTEGLGEGSIVQATNGDIVSMSWFPYVGGDLKLDKFYAILYDDSEMSWRWCYNRITEPIPAAPGRWRSSDPSTARSAAVSGPASW